MSAPTFQPLAPEWVASAHRLSTQAGWNQSEEDWRRLARLQPEAVRVWVDAGEVRASYSAIAYGQAVAWIGMILVDTAYRGGGLGKATFHAALESAHSLGATVLGLDATDLGEPIYRKFGFETIAPTARWCGTLLPGEPGQPIATGWSEALPALDHAACGEDRAALLHDLAHHGGTLLRTADSRAYACLRPGREAWQLGPVIAEDAAALSALLHAAAAITGCTPVFYDALQPESAPLLRQHGLSPLRHLKRMTLPAAPGCLCGPSVQAGAGFEWG